MYDFDKKFEKFSKIILSQASEKRDELLADYEKEKISELQEFEEKCKRDYEKQSETEILNAKKECSREIAQAITERKKEIFAYRESLIDSVFEEVDKKFSEFKKSADYFKYLVKQVNDAKKELKSDKLVITLDVSDEALAGKLKNEFNAEVKTETGITGGAIVLSSETSVCCDLSYSKKISDLRETFLEKSGFSIY